VAYAMNRRRWVMESSLELLGKTGIKLIGE
jgi:hypothetical protein